MSHVNRTPSRWLILAAMSLALGACSQTKVPAEISGSLQGLKREILLGRDAVSRTTRALAALRNARGSAIRPQYDAYVSALDGLGSKAGGVAWVADMSADQSARYFKNWDDQIDSISDKDLRQAGAERHQKAADEYAKLRALDADLRAAFRPYMSRLVDLRTSLGVDLTDEGLAKAKPTIGKAIDNESEILSRVDAIVKQIDAMSN